MSKVLKILILVLFISGGLFNFGSFENLINQGIAEDKIEIKSVIEIAETEEIIEQTLIKKARENPNEFQRVIILFHKKPAGRKEFVESLGGRVIHDYSIINGIAITLPGRAIERLKELKNVASIQEDRVVQAFLSESIPLINADDIWNSGYDGSGKTVCVIDTGVDDSHPAINTLVAEKCYCQGNSGSSGCCPGGGEVEDNAMDDNGHGTHCAGIIASQGDATHQKGVAHGASLMAVKVLDYTGSGLESDIVSGIQWCSAQGADVISISLGGGFFFSHCDGEADAQAVNNAVIAGAVVLVASGNEGLTTAISSPACASKAISVGDVYDADVGPVGWGNPLLCQDAITFADKIVCHSNRNSILDLLAPGALIMSTVLENGFANYGGTSMAAPHVSGAVALLLQKDSSLTSAQIEDILKSTGDPIYDSGSGITFPRINVYSAFGAPTEPDLTLSSDDIGFSNDSPSPDETITISAVIHNDGIDYSELSTTNIASQLNGANPATADSYLETYIPENVNDGNYSTAWASAGNSGRIQIDLSEIKTIGKVYWNDEYFVSDNQPGEFIIEISIDDISYTTIDSVTGYTGSSYTKILDTPIEVRYIKMEMTARGAGSLATLCEFEAETYYNTAIKFYDGDPSSGGTQIDATQYLPSIPFFGTETASVEWVTTFGSHDIYVEVDPNNSILEFNENNNKDYKSIFVGEDIISITIENNSFDYGTLPLSPNPANPVKKSTVDLGKTPVIENTGNVAVDLAVKSGDAEGDTTPWNLIAADSIFSNNYCHQYSTDSTSWYDFPTDNGYSETVVTGLSVNDTAVLDLQILMPTYSTDTTEKSITVTIMATQTPSP